MWWWVVVVVVDQPITDPISGSSLDFLYTCLEDNQDVREDPELDNYVLDISSLRMLTKLKECWYFAR